MVYDSDRLYLLNKLGNHHAFKNICFLKNTYLILTLSLLQSLVLPKLDQPTIPLR